MNCARMIPTSFLAMSVVFTCLPFASIAESLIIVIVGTMALTPAFFKFTIVLCALYSINILAIAMPHAAEPVTVIRTLEVVAGLDSVVVELSFHIIANVLASIAIYALSVSMRESVLEITLVVTLVVVLMVPD